MNIDLTVVAWIVSCLAIFTLGCWCYSNFEETEESLELRAARVIANEKDSYLLACNPVDRHEHLHAEYAIFAARNKISYKDYLLLVITYGTLHLI